MPEFDVDALRARFPALAIEQAGGRWRCSTARRDPGPGTVIEAVGDYYRTSNANHGGTFLTSERIRRDRRRRHAALADLLNAAGPDEIKLGANMTTLTMHVARSITARCGRATRSSSRARPRGNVGPWRSAAPRIAGSRSGRSTSGRTTSRSTSRRSTRSSTARPKLVAFGWASNAVGSINPVGELVRRAHEAGALTYVDAVHAAPHLPIDVQAVGTDFLACSVYKFFGPHVGVLYGRADGPRRAAHVQAAAGRATGSRPGPSTTRGSPGSLAAVEYIAEVGRAVRRGVRGGVPGHDRAPAPRARRHGGDPGVRDAAVRAARSTASSRSPGRGSGASPTARGSPSARRPPPSRSRASARGRRRGARRAGDRDLVGQLLRRRGHRAAGPRARGRAPDRADPLQHGGRGRPARRRAARRSPPARPARRARAVTRAGRRDHRRRDRRDGARGRARRARRPGHAVRAGGDRGGRLGPQLRRRVVSRPTPSSAPCTASRSRGTGRSPTSSRRRCRPRARSAASGSATEPSGILAVGWDEERAGDRARRDRRGRNPDISTEFVDAGGLAAPGAGLADGLAASASTSASRSRPRRRPARSPPSPAPAARRSGGRRRAVSRGTGHGDRRRVDGDVASRRRGRRGRRARGAPAIVDPDRRAGGRSARSGA